MVTTSSTRMQALPLTASAHRSRTARAPARFSARSVRSSRDWSTTALVRRSAGATTSDLPPDPRPATRATAALARSPTGSPPRRRRDAGDDGSGTTSTCPPVAAQRPSTGSAARAVATDVASASASTAERSRRSSSLYAVTASRSAPSNRAAAQHTGIPGGGGSGPVTPAPPMRDAARTSALQAPQSGPPGSRQAAHRAGRTRSAAARTASCQPAHSPDAHPTTVVQTAAAIHSASWPVDARRPG